MSAPTFRSLRIALVAGTLALAGCSSFGPGRLAVDRANYSLHLRETEKQQLLLNVVAFRYGEPPLVLGVTSVISQYTREGSLRAELPIDPVPDDADGLVGGDILLRETPTITYTPLSGDRYSHSMLTPLAPAALLGMIEAGWSVGPLFRIGIRSINGVSQRSGSTLFAQTEDPGFDEVLAALERLQRSQAIAIDVARSTEGGFTARPAGLERAMSANDAADIALVRRRLNLSGSGNRLSVVFAGATTGPDQLAITTRSMLEILAEMARGVEVPQADEVNALPAPPFAPGETPLLRVRSSNARPADAHVAVQFRGHWFWIEATDAESKRSFLIAQILMSLNDTSGDANAPLVTIPAG